jgi:hypothetical protein
MCIKYRALVSKSWCCEPVLIPTSMPNEKICYVYKVLWDNFLCVLRISIINVTLWNRFLWQYIFFLTFYWNMPMCIMLIMHYELKVDIVYPWLHTSYLNVNYNVVLYACICMSRRPYYAINFQLKLNGSLRKYRVIGNFTFRGISVVAFHILRILKLLKTDPLFSDRHAIVQVNMSMLLRDTKNWKFSSTKFWRREF